jgi:hypothetical protein
MRSDVRTEIEALHAFFEAWFTGVLPDDDSHFARCGEALAPGFTIISPDGRCTGRTDLLVTLRAAHGSHAPGTFLIRVDDVRVRALPGGLVLATYEEWQESAVARRGRLSSALLGDHADAPGGLTWLHVHETWLSES